jgi:outer membrane protein assembly factor BamE (lipoprotein component of BamABCDE complex)
MSKLSNYALLVVYLFLLCSCSPPKKVVNLTFETGAPNLSIGTIMALQPGKTTCKEVKGMFGKPLLEDRVNDETILFDYHYNKWSYARAIEEHAVAGGGGQHIEQNINAKSGLHKTDDNFTRVILYMDMKCILKDFQLITTWAIE